MMRTAPITIMLSIMGNAVCAQPASDEVKALEACFQHTRSADEICSNAVNGTTGRLNCLQQARTAQRECLEHILQGKSIAVPLPKTPSVNASSETPPVRAPAKAVLGTAPPESIVPAGPLNAAVGATPPLATREAPPRKSTIPPELSPGALGRDEPTGTVPAEPATRTAPPKAGSPVPAVAPELATRVAPPDRAASPTGGILPVAPAGSDSARPLAKAIDIAPKPAVQNWVVSETSSPVDYTPLVTAVIRVPSNVKDAPDTLTIRCRALRTELLIRTEGTWHATLGSDVEVDYQVNDQNSVRLRWTASADGKTASYKNDAIDLLRSLPEGGGLKINVLDGPGPGHQATFHLTGLDVVRKKIAAACRWPADKLLSRNR